MVLSREQGGGERCYRESTENWSEVLRDIRRRLECPRLVVGDGHRNLRRSAGGRATLLEPQGKRARQASKATTGPGQAHAGPTRRLEQRLSGSGRCSPGAATIPTRRPQRPWSLGPLVTFYDFPKEHWGHLRYDEPGRITALRLRTDAALQEGSGDSGDLENVDDCASGVLTISVHSMRMNRYVTSVLAKRTDSCSIFLDAALRRSRYYHETAFSPNPSYVGP